MERKKLSVFLCGVIISALGVHNSVFIAVLAEIGYLHLLVLFSTFLQCPFLFAI